MDLIKRLEKSERLLKDQIVKQVYRTEVKPRWINNQDIFWYMTYTRDGNQYYKVDIENNEKTLLFDHNRLARALKGLGETCDIKDLGISGFSFTDQTTCFLNRGMKKYKLDLETYQCELVNQKNPMDYMGKSFSPNGKFVAYTKEYNLYVKKLETDEDVQLTFDGEKDYAYAAFAGTSQLNATMERNQMIFPPALIWSKDGNKLLTYKTDERKCHDMVLLHSAPKYGEYSKAYSYKSTSAGSEVPKAEFIGFDLTNSTTIDIDMPPMDINIPGTVFTEAIKYVWFGQEDVLYFVYVARGYQKIEVFKYNMKTKESVKIIEEESDKFVELSQSIFVVMEETSQNSELIGFSTRDGWGHLYLYDGLSGGIKNQITKGNFSVFQITRIDESKRQVYFLANGKEDGNPYYHYLYRINFDGSDMKLLTPELGHHTILDVDKKTMSFIPKHSPSGKYFIDTFSEVNTPPKTVIRDREGQLIMVLEEGDISQINGGKWSLPEPFIVKARDDKTDLYGVMYKPSYFDPRKSYPVIDNIYPGPQTRVTPLGFDEMLQKEATSLAELGFIVIHVDGLGTPGRSKEYHDFAFNNFKDGTLPDHIAGIKQLCKKYSFMDQERVGIYGISAGGYATCLAMFNHSDFYKVGVATNSFVDARYYLHEWTEKYMTYPYDEDLYDDFSLIKMVDGLQGRLLMLVGDFDENINAPSQIMLANAMIKAKKEFDIFIGPNSGHHMDGNEYMYVRKRYNYFLKHLRGEEIPLNVEYPKVKLF